jgi:hypothetical protein
MLSILRRQDTSVQLAVRLTEQVCSLSPGIRTSSEPAPQMPAE